MTTSETIDKSVKLPPAEDYNFLRREGIKHIEKLAGDVWTDYNTHDPGITLLENLCYAITDLAYRANFDISDLLSKNNADPNKWKHIFYTAREILPCNSVTINDYRKLVMDVEGVRNAWITPSKDCEVPIYLQKPDPKLFDRILEEQQNEHVNKKCCHSSIHLPYAFDEAKYGLNYSGTKIIELNGLYKIIVEYEEDVIERKQENEVRNKVLRVLHQHRNVCEDFLSVTGAEYKDFFLQAKILIAESADADLVLAQICYGIQNYFTPVVRFYSLDEMVESGMPVDEIFEGPALKHGFIHDEELEKTDMFRDMRLSDIINFISDIDGINALQIFKITVATDEVPLVIDEKDHCGNEQFFAEWINRIKKEKLVGRLSVDDIVRSFHYTEEDLIKPISGIHFFKPSGEVVINTDRFLKLLNDLRGKDKYMKMAGFRNNFPVPVGENMELDNFYPVQYQLPFVYRVGETGLPLRDGKKRLIQSLQLKGYLAVFEQLFLNYLHSLDNMNEIFSLGDVKFNGTSYHPKFKSACEQIEDEKPDDHSKELTTPGSNLIIYKEDNEIVEKILGYKCLYYDAEKYINGLQGIIETEADFEWNRNQMLDHLLARFNEQMTEYVSLMKYMYPNDYLVRVMKSKSDLLSDYPAISNNRSRAYNYKLEEEEWNYENATWDEDKIALNISGLEKRIARLIGLSTYRRRDLSPDNLFLVKITGADGKKLIKVVLYEDETKEKVLLESRTVEEKCCDEIMHVFIDSGCCQDNFYAYPEQQAPHKRMHHHQHHAEYFFVLKDKNHREIARSPVYPSAKRRDEAMQLAKCYLEKICGNEGFHIIEHILLRPKGDTQLTDENDQPYGEEFMLLDICLDKCDLSIEQDATDTVDYKFDLQVLPPEECLDGKRWKVLLNRIRPLIEGKPVKILEHTLKDFDLASDFISNVREYGSELVNYTIYKTKASGDFYFKLKDKNGTTLVESSCFSTYSSVATIDEKAIPGARNMCDVTINDRGIFEEIEKIKEFLAYELDLYCCEEPCDHNEDPYSFRITFVLPCWPKRFRDKGFRKLVEKTIRSETPAHIQPNIFWLGITEMRNYEEAYFDWLVEMAANDTPDIGICNSLIGRVINLKNCDEQCEDKESIYSGKIQVH